MTPQPASGAGAGRGPLPTRLLALLVLVALLASGCTLLGGGDDAPVRARSASSAGVTVTLPEGVAGELTVEQVPVPASARSALPPGGQPVGDAVAVSVTGLAEHEELPAPATVSFPVPEDVGEQEQLVVLWEDREPGTWRWLPAEVDRAAGTVSATTDHFSRGLLAKIDVEAWVRERGADLRNALTGRAGVAAPTCDDEDVPRAAVDVLSDGGSSVKWCLGAGPDGQWRLKVANDRRTYTSISHPKAWTVAPGGPGKIGVAAMARALGTAESRLYAVGSGRTAHVVSPGDTLELIVPAGSTGSVTAEFSSWAWFTTAIMFGVDTLIPVAKAANSSLASAAQGGRGTLLQRLAGTGPNAPELDAELRACLKSVAGLTEVDTSLASSLRGVADLAWDCGTGVMTAVLDRPTVRVFGKTVVVGTVVAVTQLVTGGVSLVLSGSREVVDLFAAFAGRSDPVYDIVLRQRQLAPCDRPDLLEDLGAAVRSVEEVDELRACEDDWALVVDAPDCEDCVETGEALQHVDGSWTSRLYYPGEACADALEAEGASAAVVDAWPSCGGTPGSGLDPACEEDEVSVALCRFVVAVQSGDTGALSEQERAVAAQAGDLPDRSWTVTSCELEGDVTVLCEIAFDGTPEDSEPASAGFRVQPVNGEYDAETGAVVLPEGEELRYEVVEYAGLGVGGTFGY